MGYRNLLLIIIPLLVGSISGFFTRNAKEVFAALHKPAFAPPPSVFGPVWTVLYLLMGIALYRVVQSGKDIKTALILFAIQLLLNFIWSPVFFVWEMRFLALVIILILLVVILLTAFNFYKVDKLAGILFIPYILWVSFATVLTYALYQLNK
ncbi:TspO and MBR related proteins [Thermosyntropha lipolytica DSM 11003]|uniref:TspO and MBR related proteins n=1 Tax=Thermosyntropha lipolytica DSM 11003 TaxID=1123382 RepID=A0A1M5JBP7_9FIRM|nr:TspO/MBR family protein [Thermosyntropha lipolytica]SHG37660.1 TspO and MBR related proteins [Thermosyntropha lipolytica DSM 11003]